MGKLNVTILRYLSKEDFRVLTAVSKNHYCGHLIIVFQLSSVDSLLFRLKWA